MVQEHMQRGWSTLRGWFANAEPVVVIGALLVVLGVSLFIGLADEVVDGDTQQFDERVMKALRRPDDVTQPIGPRWLQQMGHDATALGGVGWLVSMTLAVTGYLWLDGKRHMALFLLLAASSGTAISFLLKSWFARPRPSVVPHLTHVTTSSFPSAHSMMSAIIYITLGVLVATVVAKKSLKIYILTLSLLLTVVVGASRVFLGVHYPTDVLAGWAAGLAWALLCWLVAVWLQQIGEVERPE